MILHDWTHQPYFSLHVNYQSYGYTRLIADSILRRASPGDMRSCVTPTSKMLRHQVTMALMWFWKRHSFSIFKSCKQMPFIWCWTHLSYTYVQFISEVLMLLWCCFTVQYPSQSVKHDAVVNSTHSKSNFPWLRYVSSNLLAYWDWRIFWTPSDRLRLWKHWYHSVSFPVVVWSPSVTCQALHKEIWMCPTPTYPQNSY